MECRWSAGTWGRAIRTLGVLAASFVWAACNGISGIDAPESATASAVEPAVKQPSPVGLDREKLAGLGLEEYPAMSSEEVLEGGSGHRGEVFFSLIQEDQFCTGHLGTSGLGPGLVFSL